MNICIVTREDCLHLNDPLKYVIANSRHKVSALILTDKVPRFYTSSSYKVRAFLVTLLAMRTRFFLKTVIKGIRCAISGRNATLESFARSRGIPVFHVETPNSPACIRLLSDASPDVIIHQSHFIVKRPFLMTPRICTLNRHGSLLPLYRGMLAPFWALHESAPAAGVTIHTVDESIDGGKIVVQETIPIASRECLGSLLEKMFSVSGELFCRALDRIDADRSSFRFAESPGAAPEPAQGRTYKFPLVQDIVTYRLRRISSLLSRSHS